MSSNTLKFIAFAALLEYAIVRPFIMHPAANSTDFIGFVLVHSIMAYFGKINLLGFDAKRRDKILKYGLTGGVLGYAWMLLYIRYNSREVQHLFIANALILAGILYGSWSERRKLPRSQRTPGGGGNPSRSVPQGFLDPTSRMVGGCANGMCG